MLVKRKWIYRKKYAIFIITKIRNEEGIAVSFKEITYSLLVDANPIVKEMYETPIMANSIHHKKHRLYDWVRLLKLIIKYRIFKFKPIQQKEVPIQQKEMPIQPPKAELTQSLLSVPESATSRRKGAHWFAKEFLQYDLVTVDIFEVLIILPCDLQSLFSIMESKLEIHNFSKIRKQAEQILETEKKFLSLKNIHLIVSQYTCYPEEVTAALEFDIIKSLVRTNPYIARTISILINMGIEIAIVSNVHLSAIQIAELLELCGYEEMTTWITHEHNCTNISELYVKILDKYGWNIEICHITNNTKDRDMLTNLYCIDVYKYKTAKSYGQKYRKNAGQPVSVKLYNGIINLKMHSENNEYDQDYELGYKSGAYVVAFCNKIYLYALKNNISKIVIATMHSNIYQRVFYLMFEDIKIDIELLYIPALLSESNTVHENFFEYFKELVALDENTVFISTKHYMRNLLTESHFFDKYKSFGYSIQPFFCEYTPALHLENIIADITIEEFLHIASPCIWKLKSEENGIVDFIMNYKKVLAINDPLSNLNERDTMPFLKESELLL